MTPHYPHLAARLFNTPLLLHPGKLAAIVAGLGSRLNVEPAPTAYATPTARREQGGYRLLENGIGVLEIFGVLAHRANFGADSSYIEGYETIARTLDSALNDSRVKALVLQIDSPGGEVAGAFQLADQIHAARRLKPIVAVASDLAASAGYLIASAAESVSVSRTAVVGSIGVVTCHADLSRALDQQGVAITYLYAGAHKVDGNPYQSLPPEVAARIQADVDYYYSMFLDAVASYRLALSVAALRATEAETYIGPQAITGGLADFLETPDQVIARLSARFSSSKSRGPMAPKESPMSNQQPVAVPEVPEDDSPVSAPAPAPAPEPIPAARALDVGSIVRLCNAAGESRLAEILVSGSPTVEQVNARLAAAAEVRRVCAIAKTPELADELIAAGADREAAMLATWQALADRSAAHPVDHTPPLAQTASKLPRAVFEALPPARRREFVMAGGTVTD